MFKSYSLSEKEIARGWILIDAKEVILGRLAALVSNRLRGKHKATYTPHMDCGDNIVIINAKHVKLTGNKATDRNGKKYYWHTGHPGGIKEINAKDLIGGKYPERVLKKAIERMMPTNKLANTQLKHLFIYPDAEHKHEAQQPKVLDVKTLNEKNKR
ncbi:MAG: 50S ribosomal protein L13 [Rickettsiales bacterium]|nr:50S ribosomal protein L13 [Rickettsiales bacterium]